MESEALCIALTSLVLVWSFPPALLCFQKFVFQEVYFSEYTFFLEVYLSGSVSKLPSKECVLIIFQEVYLNFLPESFYDYLPGSVSITFQEVYLNYLQFSSRKFICLPFRK